MSKIIGVTVGTPLSANKIEEQANVSGQINSHNEDTAAHEDIRAMFNDITPANIGAVKYGFNNTGSANAADCKAYWEKMPAGKVEISYNQNGFEATIIFSKNGAGNYGNIIRFSYGSTTIQFLRYMSGTGWVDADWATMDARNATLATSAGQATKLATARKINGVDFDGTADITVEPTKVIPVPLGGTGAASVADARENLGVPSKADLTNAYGKIISMGEQLVINGNGFMGDNTNFSSLNFDGTQANNSPGSFTYPAGYARYVYNDEFIPVDLSKDYVLSFDLKTAAGLANFEANVRMFDVDKLEINSYMRDFSSATLTTLTQDLVAGDTVVHVADVSKWSYTATYRRRIAVFNYVNSYGYLYEPLTYTRNFIELPANGYYPADGTFDTANNTITLASAYSGETIPAGTYICQGTVAHSTYALGYNGIVPAEWSHYEGEWSGSRKWAGTAFVKLYFYWNTSRAADQLWGTNIFFREKVTGTPGPTGPQGPAGPQGPKGDTGATGADGAKGDKGDTGEKGADGAPGYTPVKGTDYYTEADKSEMVNLVLAAMPTWGGGSF